MFDVYKDGNITSIVSPSKNRIIISHGLDDKSEIKDLAFDFRHNVNLMLALAKVDAVVETKFRPNRIITTMKFESVADQNAFNDSLN